ncbi:bZIP transcription factor [Fibrisoma montanum]|uniref:bZIP transcription factor n=1 Tax=Fibrisoma montanum TaxID=2305895 RepID=UPI0018F685C9|nr:bZIP transcription factor [Fibrisoma montanum]
MMGTNAGSANTTGTANFFLGDNAGGGNTGGSFNVYLGANAGNGAGVNGSNNLAIGFEAGRANVAGINNTFLGFRADAGANGLQNATAIGNNARVSVSNAVVLGEAANVGIGTSSPAAKLHLVSGVENSAGLRFGNLTSNSPASATNQTKFLSVDGSGNVILASTTSGGREAAVESLWQRNGRYLTSKDDNAVIIGSNVSKTPVGYRLYVQDGILTEKVKVAIKNTADWSDKVFAPSYKLRPLAEVEQFIQTHQHLPGVPSAEEVVKQGVDVGQMDAKLLEKIEELTLYSIQLENELKKVKQQQADDLRAMKQKQAQLERLLQEVLNKK